MASGLFDDVPNVGAKRTSSTPPSPSTTAGGGLFDDVPDAKKTSAPSAEPTTALDVATDPLRGFNKGLAEVVSAPYRALDWAVETASGGRYGLPDIQNMPVWSYYLNPKKPTTTAGRYLQRAGEAVGAAAVPAGTVLGIAGRATQAAGPATTTLGGIARDAINAVRAAPAQTLALDAASAASSGIGAQAAEDMGYGPTGQMVGAMVGGLTPAGIMAYRTPSNTGIGTTTGATIARRRATEAAADAEAFVRQDVRPFGPAFNQGPVASVGKQITETPYVGAPLRNNLDETMQDAAAAVDRTAGQISATATPEEAGRAVQRGLQRFSSDGVERLEPGRLTGLGIQPYQPIQPPTIMSAAAARRLQQAEAIRQQERQAIIVRETQAGASMDNAVQTAMREVPDLALARNQLYTARRSAPDLSDAELARVIETPATQTSFAARREALYEYAWRQVPTMLRSDGRVNTRRLSPTSTRQALRQIDGQVASNISGQGTLNGPLANRIRNPNAHFSLDDLRSIRTEIGRAMSEFNPAQQTLSQSQLRNLYGAVSRDIEVGVQDIANRALLRSRLNPADPDYIASDVANRAAQALRAFQRADRYNRSGMTAIERFERVMGTENPQAAAQALINRATDGTRGNMQMVRAAMSPLRPEDRASFASVLVRELGRPVDSARGVVQEVGWSPSSFVTRYNKLSPEARDLMFSPEHRQAIDDLFRIANRLSNVDALANTSRSGTNTINIGGGVAAVGSAVTGDFVTPLAIGGSMLGTSILMSRPAYTQWMVRYMQLRAAVREGTDRTIAPLLRHVSGLERMAHDNPALWPAYIAVSTETEGMTGKPANADAAKASPQAATRLLSQARNALRRGAERSAVEDRLRALGVDPRDL